MLPTTLDIKNPGTIEALNVELQQWVQDDESAQSIFHEEWNKVDKRLVGDDVPAGFSTLYSQDYANAEKNKALKTVPQMFVPINRAHAMREGVLGDFITGKKTLTASGRNMVDRRLASVISQYIQYVLDAHQFNDALLVPALDRMISKGLDWLGAEYDQTMNYYKGGIRVFRANCRDVLVDAHAQVGSFYQKDTRRTLRYKVRTDWANQVYRRRYKALYTEDVTTDTDYDMAYIPVDLYQSKNSTFYRIEFLTDVDAISWMDPETERVDCVPVNEAMEMNIDPRFVIAEDPKEFLFRVIYSKQRGVFHLERLPYSTFTLTPLINIESDGRRYPVGDIKIYDNLLDLISVVATVLVENAKRANHGIGGVDEAVWRDPTLLQAAQDAIKHGGIVPGLKTLEFPSHATAIITNLITIVQGWLADVASRHPASQGELPTNQIAEDTVRMLIAQDRQTHSRKDVSVRLGLTTFARTLAEMTVIHITEDEMVEVTDATPGTRKYVPINKQLTETEYNALIADMYELEVPEAPTDDMAAMPAEQEYIQALQMFQAQFNKAKRDFERTNDVKKLTASGYAIGKELVSTKELQMMIGESGLSVQDFQARYNPQPAQVPVYEVNMMPGRRIDLNLRFEVDVDYEADSKFRQNRAFMLRKMGEISGLDLLKEIQMPNADELHEHAVEENSALQMAKEIAADPDLFNAAKAAIQSSRNPQSAQDASKGKGDMSNA